MSERRPTEAEIAAYKPRDMADERQALFDAATVIARVARRIGRHPRTRAVMLRVADRLYCEANARLDSPVPIPAPRADAPTTTGEGERGEGC